MKKENNRKNYQNYLKTLLYQYKTLEGLGLNSLTSCILYSSSDPVIFLYNMMLSISVIKDLMSIKRKTDIYNYNLLRYSNENNDKYIELKNEYDKFTDLLAEYIKMQNFDDSLDIAVFYMVLLHSGEISITDSFEYKQEENNNDCKYFSTLGARVVSGFGVCRHMAALLNDVYRKLGYNSVYLRVKSYDTKNIFKYMKCKLKRDTHAVVLVDSKEGNLIIDPTWTTFSSIFSNYEKTENMFDSDGTVEKAGYKFIDYIEDTIYYMIDENTEFKKSKIRRLTPSDIEESFDRVARKMAENWYKGQFKNYCIDLMETIQELEYNLNLKKDVKEKVK